MNITNIVKFLFMVLAAIWTCFLLPWLQTKKDAAQRESLAETIRTAVKAAQQIYDLNQGTEKKAYVLNWLRAQGFKLDDTAVYEMIDAMIESAVLDLKKEANQQPQVVVNAPIKTGFATGLAQAGEDTVPACVTTVAVSKGG